MQKITPEYLDFARRKAPHVVQVIEGAKADGKTAPLRLEVFADDPFLLYTCLWYAYSEGVVVTLSAPGQEPPEHQSDR